MKLPPSVRVEFGGLFTEQQRSFRALSVVFASAVLLVAALLLYLYESWAIVFAILATVGLSVAAVFLGLWMTGTELNISAIMGMTMIVGIVAELAVFYFSELVDSHESNSLVDAGKRRLRPILMTALIAILALLPLALGIGAGSAMQTPLAIAIICGLIAALPLVLLVMPVFYQLFSRERPNHRARELRVSGD
jgi:multidrug efflux pump subunit AcrB